MSRHAVIDHMQAKRDAAARLAARHRALNELGWGLDCGATDREIYDAMREHEWQGVCEAQLDDD